MIVTGATVNANDDFILGKHAGSVGRLIINPGSTINVADRWYNNDNGGSGFDTRVTQNGGTVNIGYRLYLNDDAGLGSYASWTLNDGIVNVADEIDVSWHLDATAHLTINGGQMYSGEELNFGIGLGDNLGESRLFLNGGLFQAEALNFNMADSMILFTGGQFRINGSAVSVGDMENLIGAGKIDVSGAPAYVVYTDGDYTVLAVPEPSTLMLLAVGGLGLLWLGSRRRR
jgi:hypothetical protein